MTWCTKDKNGTAPPAAGAQPYTLWRYAGASCSGTGTQWVSNFVDKTDAPSITAGQIFNAAFVPAASVTSAFRRGAAPGTYSYEVTAVLASGVEVPGVVASLLVSSATLTNTITLTWPTYAGATSYNVYGRAYSGMRLLKNVTSSPYVDTGPTSLTDSPTDGAELRGRSPSTSPALELQLGCKHDCLRALRRRQLHRDRDIAGPLHRLQRRPGRPVSGGHARRQCVEHASAPCKLSVSLALDTTPADTKQRFVLRDDIVLRNSRPF